MPFPHGARLLSITFRLRLRRRRRRRRCFCCLFLLLFHTLAENQKHNLRELLFSQSVIIVAVRSLGYCFDMKRHRIAHLTASIPCAITIASIVLYGNNK